MRTKTFAAIGVSTALVAGLVAVALPVGGAAATRPGGHPVFARANFHDPTPNPYFPIRPGTVSRYRGTEDGHQFREVVRVTHDRKTIQGVRARVVHDVLRRADGSLAEKTQDWYANDHAGNVWYLGERTATYDRHGNVRSREGSWQAGVNGARAGLIMPASPGPTDAYRQEFLPGQAEDQAWIVQRGMTTTVPFGTVTGALRSFEWTVLEPQVISMKVYGRGLGIVREKDVAGGNESFVLVSVRHR